MPAAKYLSGLSVDAIEAVKIWGDNLRVARKARGWSEEEAASRFLMSRHTLRQMEGGDPSVGVGAYVAALDVMGLTDGLETIGASYRDQEARRLRR